MVVLEFTMSLREVETPLTVTRVELKSGTIVDGKFLIVREIGKGGVGTVYEAQHLSLGKSVAIKMLQSQSLQESTRHRFLREAQLTSMLTHPNIVALREFGVEGETLPYLVMDLLPGLPLDKLIQSGQTRDSSVYLKLASQIGQAMAYAHDNKIIHRDLKPCNIIVEGIEPEQFFARIVDFGIAKVLCDASSALTRTGEIVGTPNYMSPEQATGALSDERSDIYSFGCMLYELCEGQPPFQGDSIMSVIAQHVHALPQKRFIDDKFWLLIERCMAKDPANRYQTFHEVVEDLERLRNGKALRNQRVKPGESEHSSSEIQLNPVKISKRKLKLGLFLGVPLLYAIYICVLMSGFPTQRLRDLGWLLGSLVVGGIAVWHVILDLRKGNLMQSRYAQLDFVLKCLIVVATLAQILTDFESLTNWITQTNFLPDWLAVLGIFTKLLLWFLLVPLFCLRILWKSESARNAVIAVLIVFAGLLCLRWPLTMVLQSAYLDQAVAPNMHMRPNINRTRPFLNAALFINPLDTDCLAARAKSYVETNDFQLALDDYTKLISLKPKWNFPLCPGSNIFCLCMVELEDVYCDRARIFKVTNQIDLAIADLTEAIKLDPKNTEHYFERALLYGKQGDFASAKRDLDTARQLAPAASALLFCQAKLYKAEGRRTEALSVITKYVERTEDYRGYQLRAELYRELAQNVLATADYEKMQKECYKRGLMAPSAATYPYLEALAYKELGKMDEARRCAEKARQLGYRYSEANWAQFGMTEKK